MQVFSRLGRWLTPQRQRPLPPGWNRLQTSERLLAADPVRVQLTGVADALGQPTAFATYIQPTLIQYSRFVQAITVDQVSLL